MTPNPALPREAIAVSFESQGIDNPEKKALANTLYIISRSVKGVLEMTENFMKQGNPIPLLYNYLSELLQTPEGQKALLDAYLSKDTKPLFSELPNLTSTPHREFYETIKYNQGIRFLFLKYVISGLNKYTDSSNEEGIVGDVLGGYNFDKRHPITTEDAVFYIGEMIDSGYLQKYIQENNQDDSNKSYYMHSCLIRGNQEQRSKIIDLYDFSNYNVRSTLEMIAYFQTIQENELVKTLIQKSKIKERLLEGINKNLNGSVGLRDDINLLNEYSLILGNDFLQEYCDRLNTLDLKDKDKQSQYLSTYKPAVLQYIEGSFSVI